MSDELPEGWPQSDGTRPDEGPHWKSSALAVLPIVALIVVAGFVITHASAVGSAIVSAVLWLSTYNLAVSPIMLFWVWWVASRFAVWNFKRKHVMVRVIKFNVKPEDFQ